VARETRQRCREVSIRSRLADARRLAEGRESAENRRTPIEALA
jgi:hypothetical protein